MTARGRDLRPFYRRANGLRFSCTDCGNCCTRPGPVFVPPTDLARLASHLGLSERVFRRRYRVREIDGMLAIDPGDVPCPFHDEQVGCTVYEARPTQCRTWPFWPEVVGTKRSWQRAGQDCEGIDQGPRVTVQEIETHLEACVRVDLPEGDPW